MNFGNPMERLNEDSIGRNAEGVPLTIEGAYPKAKKTLDDAAIDPKNFSDLYGEDNIKRDIEEVKRLETSFEHDGSTKTSQVFEAIMFDSELYNWFGEKSETIKTSRYDDIKNGTDMLVEFEDPGKRFSHLGLAVDVTFGTTALEKKLSRIKDEIDRGELSKIKYFFSEREHFRGERSNIPRVVVGLEERRVVELASLWMNKKNEALSAHPAQYAILEEIKNQLETLKDYAKRTGKEELVAIYEKDLSMIQGVLSEKRKGLSAADEIIKDDRVFRGIAEGLSIFRKNG